MQARILARFCRTHGSAAGSARAFSPSPRSHCHTRASRSRNVGASPVVPMHARSATCAQPAHALRPAPSSCCARRPAPPGARRPRRARRLRCRSSAPAAARTCLASTSRSSSVAPCTREPEQRSTARAAPSKRRAPRRSGSGNPSGIAPPRGRRTLVILDRESRALPQGASRATALPRSRRRRRILPRHAPPSRCPTAAARPSRIRRRR